MLGFNADFSVFYFDTGIRSWGGTVDPTDASDATDPTDPSDDSDASDASDATDASDSSDASDATDPGECTDTFSVETPLPDDANVQDVTLRFDCWDADTGTPVTAAYTDQYNNYAWQEFESFFMEAVDADNDWAEYKLVATMADTSRRIIFFTDPTAASGQLQMLGFSNDFSAFYFDTGIRSWGEQAPSCDVNLEIQTPLPDDADTQDLTLRLDCWDADTGAPTTAAYTDQYNNYAWQEFTEIAMEAVDADNDWAAYKLVGTMADESKRIVFFTDPAATAGQMQVLGFNNDFSVFYFDTGIRSWGEEEPVCNNVEVQTPLPDDASVQDLTIRLDCWDADTGAPDHGCVHRPVQQLCLAGIYRICDGSCRCRQRLGCL